MRTSHLLMLAICSATQPALASTPAAQNHIQPPPGCAAPSASEFPVRHDVDFEADIRPRITGASPACTNCHGTAGSMSLAPQNARNALIGTDERGQASPNPDAMGMLRVRPFEPYASALLLKISCEIAPYGASMPIGGTVDRRP
jgi:hypothetical protein